jgi:hypothetical protein
MKVWYRFKNVVKSLVFSLELLSLIICTIIYIFLPSIFGIIAKQFYFSKDYDLNFLMGLPALCLATSVPLVNSILHASDKKPNLYKWPDYQLLKDSAILGLVICGISLIAVLSSWVFKSMLLENFLGYIYFTSSLIACISTVSLYFASLKIKELLGQYSDEN